ncbi:uncharacterized protein LOC135988728 [Caloenas nicobarica]|uniref:uncharacterized protein LOC135988728 n=1 Tax=Caloenas nicobarica TaxID=187106 RepID=UPI0032B74ACF
MVGGSFPSGQPEWRPPLLPPSPPPPAPPPLRRQASAHPAPQDLSAALASSPSPAARPGTGLPLPEGGGKEQAAPARPDHGSTALLRPPQAAPPPRSCATSRSPFAGTTTPSRQSAAHAKKTRALPREVCWDM